MLQFHSQEHKALRFRPALCRQLKQRGRPTQSDQCITAHENKDGRN
jgi:hypothetical protein